MGKPNEPIWFNENKVTTLNADTYQTIKTNKVESGIEVTEINLGRSPHKIMVCTPCHSDVSMHYTQAVLKFQHGMLAKKNNGKFYFIEIFFSNSRKKFMCS